MCPFRNHVLGIYSYTVIVCACTKVVCVIRNNQHEQALSFNSAHAQKVWVCRAAGAGPLSSRSGSYTVYAYVVPAYTAAGPAGLHV